MANINKYIKALLQPTGGHQGSHKAHQAGNQIISLRNIPWGDQIYFGSCVILYLRRETQDSNCFSAMDRPKIANIWITKVYHLTIPDVSNRFYLNDGDKFWHYRVEQLLKEIIYGIYNGYPFMP